MNILVVGATGPSGREVVAAALAAGHKVTAFSRHPQNGGFTPEVRLVAGDVRDAAAVAAAIEGQDAVISTLGNNRSMKNAPPCADGIRNIIAAMKAAGLKRLIALSAYGTGGAPLGLFGWILSTLLAAVQRDKEAMEHLLEQSGLDWTAVRSPALYAKPKDAPLAAATDIVLEGMASISTAEQGRWIVDELTACRFVGKKPIIYRA
jgi:uncharacterized protein YbjT (DUF2867 family)